MINGLKTFQALSETGRDTLASVKKAKTAPKEQKVLRTFGTGEALELIGCPKSSLSEAERSGKLPSPKYIAKSEGKRKLKRYTLEDINRARDFFNTRPSKPPGAKAAVIAVTNFKGGGTKTTTAKNFAQDCALQGYKVLNIDQDHQGTETYGYGIIPDLDLNEKDTIYPFLVGETDNFKQFIRKTYWHDLDLIPANLSLYNAEFTLPSMNSIAQLKKQIPELDGLMKKYKLDTYAKSTIEPFYTRLNLGLEQVKNEYDIIVIDCPPSLGVLSLLSIYSSDGIVMPLILDLDNYASFVQFLNMMVDVHQHFPAKQYWFMKILIARYIKAPKNRKRKNDLLELVRHFFGSFVVNAEIPESDVIRKASLEMLNLFEIGDYPDKQTLQRITVPVKEANQEILDEIVAAWNKEESLIKVA